MQLCYITENVQSRVSWRWLSRNHNQDILASTASILTIFLLIGLLQAPKLHGSLTASPWENPFKVYTQLWKFLGIFLPDSCYQYCHLLPPLHRRQRKKPVVVLPYRTDEHPRRLSQCWWGWPWGTSWQHRLTTCCRRGRPAQQRSQTHRARPHPVCMWGTQTEDRDG